MRRLILLRHAKAEPPATLQDIDRPLAARGRKDSLRIGAYLAREGLRPNLVVVSPAQRTQQTWEGVGKALLGLEAETVGALYNATTFRILNVIREASDDAGSLMVIGHNPGIEELAIHLSGTGSQAGRTAMREKFPTGAFAVIDFEADSWAAIDRTKGRLQLFLAPRQIEPGEE